MSNFSFSNLKISIEQKWTSRAIEIWVVDHRPEMVRNISLAEDGLMFITEVKPDELGENLKPFLTLPIEFSQYFFKAIAEHLEQKGIKTKDANLIEGKLQATEKHLEDMREIAKKLLDLQMK